MKRAATIAQGILVLGLVTAIALIQKTSLNSIVDDAEGVSQAAVAQQDQRQRLNLNLLQQLPDFGFSNLIADWTFLNFLQYFGDAEARDVGGYDLSPEFFEVIVEQDPRFFRPYIYLTNSISTYAAQPEQAVALMEKGLQSMTPQVPAKSYYVWRYKGTDELLYLGDGEAAQKSFATAADWAAQNSGSEAELMVRLSRQTAEFLKDDPNSRTAQINAWMQVFLRAVDDTIRQQAINRIEALGGKVLLSADGQITVRYRPEE